MNLTIDSLATLLSGGMWIMQLVCVLSLALLTIIIAKVALISID